MHSNLHPFYTLEGMADLSQFDPNSAGNPNYNIFGLPFSEEEAKLIIIPIPWEVTVICGAGTARCAEQVFKASLHVDIFDPECNEAWKQGIHMRHPDKKVLMKSDYLRKEAELYIDYISRGEDVADNQFMSKTLKEVNEGSEYINNWIYEQVKVILEQGKLVALLGGDHSVALGNIKTLSEKHNEFGILQIDAHCDLRDTYMGFTYSQASIMYNVLKEIPAVQKIVQIGIRDFSPAEWDVITKSNGRIIPYTDKNIRQRQYEGETWKKTAEEIVSRLPQKVYISFDVDGLDPKLCPYTGSPVPGGFDTEQLYYLFRIIVNSGRKIIGFDICETGIGENNWDANVTSRILFKLSNILIDNNS